MTGTDTNEDTFDERLFEAVRGAYRDVHLRVPLADIQRRGRRAPQWILLPGRMRLVFAAAAAVTVVTVGSWLLLGRIDGGGGQQPASPLPSTSEQVRGKPDRPTSSSTDAGSCMDYILSELDASQRGGRAVPSLRLTLGEGQTRLLIYADDSTAITCWLSGDTFAVQGSPTAVNATAYPAGQLSYRSEDSGHNWGGVAFGRAPAGTSKVTISFPSGPDVVATLNGDWFAYFAAPGPDNNRLAEATKVTAATPTGDVSKLIQHG